MRLFKYLCLAIIVIFGFTFAILNPAMTPLNYYIGVVQLPLSLLLALVLLLGVALGVLAMMVKYLGLRRELMQWRAQQKKLDRIRPAESTELTGI